MPIHKQEGVSYQQDYKEGTELLINQLYNRFSISVEIPHYDYTTIGLRAESPVRGAGGQKEYADYTALDEMDLDGQGQAKRKVFVRKYFEYAYTGQTGVWIQHSWYNADGKEAITKVEFKPLLTGQLAAIRAGQRQYVLISLDALALVDAALAPHIQYIRQYFSPEIDSFLKYGSNDWYDAVLREMNPTTTSDPAMHQILNFEIQNPLLLTAMNWTQAPDAYPTVAMGILNDLIPHKK